MSGSWRFRTSKSHARPIFIGVNENHACFLYSRAKSEHTFQGNRGNDVCALGTSDGVDRQPSLLREFCN